jgi:hypothetical protein
MRARTGKIARLPQPIREKLNQRLRDGQTGKEIINWLNELPDVKQLVIERFAGHLISENNVSEWRRGGYQDWLREMETRIRIVQLAEKYQDAELDGRLGRRAETVVLAELLDDMDQLHRIEDDEVRSARLRRICRELARMQNVHCRGLELQLQQEKNRPRQTVLQTTQPRPIAASSTF